MSKPGVVEVLRRIDSGKASPTECAELHIYIDAVAELIAAAQDIRTNGLGTATGKRLDAALAACKGGEDAH